MPADDFAKIANTYGLKGTAYPTVETAVQAALANGNPADMIFIGGSSFIVADALPLFNSSNH